MTRRPATWKIVTFGAALTGLGAAGVGLASADDDRAGSLPAGVTVAADQPVQDAPAPAPADASPESADSPNESATDTPADASPESADSPAESAWDTADTANSANSPDGD